MSRSTAAGALALLLATFTLACGDDGEGPSRGGLREREWAFLAIEGATCADGTPTGVAVNPGPGEGLLIFLDGGGACLDYLTCVELETASNGPFDEARFRSDTLPILPGTPMDAAAPGNPFRDFSYVFVPYCTGDVHVGDRVATYYDLRLDGHEYRHVGRANLEKMLPRLQALFPAPDRVVVSGASAGGFGAVVNYELVRGAWPAARGYLVDDSGPPLRARDVPLEIRAAWVAAWRADEALSDTCGSFDCVEDWSALFPSIRRRWPEDRIALLSTLQDQVIRSFLLLSGAQYEAAIRGLATDVVAPLEGAETFLVPGSGHTFLGAPARAIAGGVTLETWLEQMVTDDPAWTSAGP